MTIQNRSVQVYEGNGIKPRSLRQIVKLKYNGRARQVEISREDYDAMLGFYRVDGLQTQILMDFKDLSGLTKTAQHCWIKGTGRDEVVICTGAHDKR
jgi:hypothetical protein